MEFELRVQGLTTGSERVGGPILIFVIPDASRATDNTTCAWSVLQVAFHFALTGLTGAINCKEAWNTKHRGNDWTEAPDT